MSVIKKISTNIHNFGYSYTFFFILKKAGVIKEIPIKQLLKRQNYYASLPVAQQKKELADYYKNFLGKELHLENPQSFTEKIQWLKFYDSTQQKADMSDKYLAPKIIAEKYGDKIKTVPQLGAWEKAEDIDFEKLPEKFALKCNHGSAMNIIIKDKSKLNLKKVRRQLNDWLKIDYTYINGMYENHYTLIDRKIIAEQFIEEMDGNLHDYKIHCFMGEPKYIQFIGDRVPNTHDYYVSFFTTDWEKVDINLVGKPYEKDFEKPTQLHDMLSLARDMSKAYPYVRVDFYCINDEIYFSELTFTPDSGIMRFNRPELDAEWGKMIELKGSF